jgi:four helix bundle protein
MSATTNTVKKPNPIARSFRDLIAYQKARVGVNAVFEITKRFPKDERFELNSQMRRSSRAAKAMIAAAWARRRYKAAFISKLDEALEEAVETQSWFDDALDRGYINETEFKQFDAEWESIGAMVQGMINRADSFCRFAPDTDHRNL